MSKQNSKESIEGEQGVLGCALIDPSVIDLCRERGVTCSTFSNGAHKSLYRIMLDLDADGKAVDLVTVFGAVRKAGESISLEYLQGLVEGVPLSSRAPQYIDMIREREKVRDVMAVAGDMLENCEREDLDPAAIVAQAEGAIFALTESGGEGAKDWREVIKGVSDRVERLHAGEEDAAGLMTGVAGIDEKCKGLKESDVIVLAARPSMGKTSLALNIAENVAVSGAGVAVFSVEMSADALGQRMVCGLAGVPFHKASANMDARTRDKLIDAGRRLEGLPIVVDDTAGIDVAEMRSKARRMARELDQRGGLKLIVVDYLQLMNCAQHAAGGRQRETSAISAGLKAMAKELKCPVIVLSQLSRAPETRDKAAVPKMSDLRDSGAIEQDADLIWLLRRPCKYPGTDGAEDPMLAILDIAKQRNGATGEVQMDFIDTLTRFRDRAYTAPRNEYSIRFEGD